MSDLNHSGAIHMPMGEADNRPDEKRGVYRKYEVKRLNDMEGKHDHCQFFVLDLDHDEYAVPALKAYAKACADKYPALSNGLTEWVEARQFQLDNRRAR